MSLRVLFSKDAQFMEDVFDSRTRSYTSRDFVLRDTETANQESSKPKEAMQHQDMKTDSEHHSGIQPIVASF